MRWKKLNISEIKKDRKMRLSKIDTAQNDLYWPLRTFQIDSNTFSIQEFEFLTIFDFYLF